VRFEIVGDLRFLSHRDTLRVFRMASIRAGLPVAYSGGFNPRPAISLPLPKPVGLASLDDLLVMDLTQELDTEDVLRRLAGELPSAIGLHRCRHIGANTKPRPLEASYEVPVPDEVAGPLRQKITEIMNSDSVTVERQRGPARPARRLDIRPFIGDLEFKEGVLRMRLVFEDASTARATEVLAVLGLASGYWLHRLVRTAVKWDIDAAEQEH